MIDTKQGQVITLDNEPLENPIIIDGTISLNIGCGSLAIKGWENIDNDPSLIEWFNAHRPDLLPFFKVKDALKEFNYADESVDRIYLSNFIEHLEPIECRELLSNCLKSLKIGGRIRIVVPDMDLILKKYQRGEMSEFDSRQPEMFKNSTSSAKLSYMLFGNLYNADPNYPQGDRYLGHKMAFDYYSLHELLDEVGFKIITGYPHTGSSKMFEDVFKFEIEHLPMWYMLTVEAQKE